VGQTLLSDSFPEFVGSTPSVAFHGGELAVVQRFVNYRINDTGGYVNQKHISTKNVVATFDVSVKPWRKTREFEMNYDRAMDSLYVGLEDVRIMSHQGALLYNANRGISIHHLMVEHGTVDVDTQQTQSGLVLIDDQKQIEKNWVLFEDGAGKLKIIYGWSDLVIGDVVAETELPSESDSDDEPDNNPSEAASLSYLFKKTHAVATPAFFKYIRGSTNGVRVGDEVWFVCHVVSYEDRRYYYHVFVALDAWTYAVKKYTPMSTFEGEKVEYTLGFVYLSAEDAFLVGYSKMDRETAYMTIPKSAIETQCLYG
jgi:hypothetical protein